MSMAIIFLDVTSYGLLYNGVVVVEIRKVTGRKNNVLGKNLVNSVLMSPSMFRDNN